MEIILLVKLTSKKIIDIQSNNICFIPTWKK